MAPTRRKPIVRGLMRVRTYPLVQDRVEDGILYGIGRLFKHREKDSITEQELRDNAEVLFDAVMNELCEAIEFDPEPGA